MDRIEQGQAHALGSLRALEGALLGLEQVVGGMADAPPPPVVERDAPHLQSAEPAPCLADGRRDITAAVLERLDQPASLEARSVQAIDQIGAEMIRVVQSLDHRVDAVEQRSDDHAAEVGREMSRLVTAMDERLTLAGDAQAGTLQALGGKIALVADQLADNIAASEQRSAQIMAKGLDAVGERLQRAIQQLNLHHDRAAGDLAELVRQREARTAALIAQAYGQVSAAKPDGAEAEPSTAERSGTEPSAAREPGPALHRDLPEQPLQPPVDIAQGETSDARAPEESLVPPPPSVRAAPPRVGAHRELIEQARAAARMNAENLRRPFQKVLTDIVREAPATSSAPPATDDVLVLRSGLGSLLRRRYV